jgi:hypothetical protein
MEYAALFEPQLEGGYLITFPISIGAFPKAMLQTMIQKHIRDGEPLPKASRL